MALEQIVKDIRQFAFRIGLPVIDTEAHFLFRPLANHPDGFRLVTQAGSGQNRVVGSAEREFFGVVECFLIVRFSVSFALPHAKQVIQRLEKHVQRKVRQQKLVKGLVQKLKRRFLLVFIEFA